MKHFLTTCLLAWAASLAAQSFNWISQPQFTNTLNTFKHGPDGRWFAGGVQYLPSKSTGTVVALLPNGQPAWKIDFDYASETEVTGLLAFPDGSLLITGGASDCDAIYPGFITMRDPDGNAIWTVTPEEMFTSSFLPFFSKALALAPDGNFFVASDQKIQKHDRATGALLEAYSYDGSNQPADFYYEAGADLFVLGGSNGVSLVSPSNKINMLIKPATPDAQIIKVMPWGADAILALTNTGVIEEFSTNSTAVTHPLSIVVKDMQAYGTGLIVCGRNPSTSVIHFVDNKFVDQGGIDLQNPDLYAQYIGTNAGGYVLAGVEMNGPAPRLPNTPYSHNYSPQNNQHFWVQHFDDDIIPVLENTGAALTELIVHTPPKAALNNSSDPYAPWEVNGGTFSVRLKNTGTIPLQSVTINAGGYGNAGYSFTCPGANTVFQELTNLNLAPGEEKIVYLGEIGAKYVSSVLPWKLCIWTSRPNGLTDRFHEDDYTCREFDLITSTNGLQQHEISLFPNPAHDAIYLENSTLNPGLCRVLNIAGQLVSDQTAIFENGVYRVNASLLPAGLYFLQTDLGWGRFVKN